MKEKPSPILRKTTQQDYREIVWLTREAFWNVHVPGCNEHYLAHMLKNSPDYLAELDFEAIADGKIVGHIMYALSTLKDNTGFTHKVITFGPVSVLPSYQGRGIGSALITHTKALAGKMGHKILIIYGYPAYYCRFGFVAGENYGIRTADGLFSPALQAIELDPRRRESSTIRILKGWHIICCYINNYLSFFQN